MVALAVIMSREPNFPADTAQCLVQWLMKQYHPQSIYAKEKELRDCLDETTSVIFPYEYATEIRTLLRKSLSSNQRESSGEAAMLVFVQEVESMVIDVSRSVLIDAEL